ncbi:hypothetical protein H1235_02445 [Pseudoxanthomonas sp. NC8]|nr:hypothetical protein H1235_02445 [Pseudoxanthomonas sp. NC8]
MSRVVAALDKIPGALEKTGFILEHEIAEAFKKRGWSTINGRYYADDVDGRARELDLVAYRTDKSADIEVVTGVLVSCKKDAEHTWAFLSKEKPRSDPNFDWDPVHYWTDVEPLKTYLANENWKSDYVTAGGSTYDEDIRAARDIFAFQLISSQTVSPKNDKPIFDSISSLLKALDHEMEVLPSRAKKRKRVYFFSLLSVVDAPLVDVDYSKGAAIAREVKKLTHFARYMVKKRDLSALIHFVRSDATDDFIRSMSDLAQVNLQFMEARVDASYRAIRTNPAVRGYFAERLKHRLVWRMNSALRTTPATKVEELTLSYRVEDDLLVVGVDVFDDDQLKRMNSDAELVDYTEKALFEIARYKGKFVFELDVPF